MENGAVLVDSRWSSFPQRHANVYLRVKYSRQPSTSWLFIACVCVRICICIGGLIAHHISCHGVNVTSVARNDERNHVVGSSSAVFISMEIHTRTHIKKKAIGVTGLKTESVIHWFDTCVCGVVGRMGFGKYTYLPSRRGRGENVDTTFK